MTKCVTKAVQVELEGRDIIAENQLGTIRNVQGAKEQAMINIALNKKYDNNLKTAWIDVKKAFDSINHRFLSKCIECLKFPKWVEQFIKGIMTKWRHNILYNNEMVISKNIKKGILQGDSLSPLLFIIIMDPLSKLLNSMFPKVQIPINEKRSYCTNHLLFIDDLKIMAERESTVQIITNETKRFFSIIGLEINTDKSATNSLILVSDSVLLTNNDCYKYLGIIEDKSSRPTRTNWELITSKIKAGVNKLCDTNLHGRNLTRGINEYATSLLNYYIRLLDI